LLLQVIEAARAVETVVGRVSTTRQTQGRTVNYRVNRIMDGG